MPQVDLETLVCGDRKIACETDEENSRPENLDLPEIISADFPAESFFLSKEDEFDWCDRNAFYERKGSTKGNFHSNSNSISSSISVSKRYSLNLKSKASIIGLPKLQKTCYLDSKFRRNCKPANVRFFPKRSRSSGKSNVPLTEPTSPKVSCIGRVRSKKERSRRLRLQLSKENSPVDRSEKHGFWTTFKAVLHFGRRKTKIADKESPTSAKPPAKTNVTSENRKHVVSDSAVGLGELNRFASGRRSDSWGGGEVDLEMDGHDLSDSGGGAVWRRRGVGPLMEVYCDREWKCVGPASV